MIKREEIIARTGAGAEGRKGLSELLDELLADTEAVDYNLGEDKGADESAVKAARDELVSGGFGNDSTEEYSDAAPVDIDDFFSYSRKRNYQLSASTAVLKNDGSEYEVSGIFREETDKYYLLQAGQPAGSCIPVNSYGLVVSAEHFLKLLDHRTELEGYDYFGAFINNSWVFYKTDKKRSHITVTFMDTFTRLFSRNQGLLESSIMNDKTALIAGCGSVGSFIALELARAGAGHFILADGDTLEIHNICRHQLGFRDLGRYKADAVADAIHNINPFAEVKVFKGTIQELPAEYLSGLKEGIVIGTGDNRESSAFANELAERLNVPFVSTGCWQRAHAGECFYWYPGAGLPKYRQAFAGLISDERPASHQNYFADENDEETLNFEPGVSTDIEFVTLVAVKIIYDLLNKDTDSYTKRVIGHLKNYTLICNTNETAIGGKNAEIFPHPLYISDNISVSGGKEAV